MSQNYFRKGNIVSMIGWDKPASSAYLIVGEIEDDAKDWKEPFLLNVELPFDRVNKFHFVDELVVHMKGKLELIGLTLPDSMYEFMVADIKDNAVNVLRIHSKSDEPKILDASPFDDQTFASQA